MMITFYKFLSLSAAGLILAGCATTQIQTLPAGEIAAKAYPAVDGLTGLEQIRVPEIMPFEWHDDVRGTAQLQTAEAFEGQSGGAWLDVTLQYSTPSSEPGEMRVYNKARWLGGDEVKIADFSAAIMTCEDRVSNYGVNNFYGHFGRFDNFGFYGPSSYYGRTPYYYNNSRRNYNRNSGSNIRAIVNTFPRSDTSSSSTSSSSGRNSTGSTSSRTPSSRSSSSSSSSGSSRPLNDALKDRFQFQDEAASVNAAIQDKASATATEKYFFGPRTYNYGSFGPRQYGYSNYGLGFGRSDYVVRSSCVRREKLRIFVPQERLALGTDRGLNLYIQGESGDQRPLALTPNYIAGFRMGAQNMQAGVSQTGTNGG